MFYNSSPQPFILDAPYTLNPKNSIFNLYLYRYINSIYDLGINDLVITYADDFYSDTQYNV